MRITPLISADIVGRYRKTTTCIYDTFIGKRIYIGNKNKVDKMYSKLNIIGLENSNRLQKHQQLLYITI